MQIEYSCFFRCLTFGFYIKYLIFPARQVHSLSKQLKRDQNVDIKNINIVLTELYTKVLVSIGAPLTFIFVITVDVKYYRVLIFMHLCIYHHFNVRKSNKKKYCQAFRFSDYIL